MNDQNSTDLVSSALGILNRAKDYDERRNLSEQTKQFESQLSFFSQTLHSLQFLCEVRNRLQIEEIPLRTLAATGDLSHELALLAKDFGDSRQVLIDPSLGKKRKNLRIRLEAIGEDRRSKTAADWKDFVLGLLPQLHDDALMVLSRVPSFSETVKEVRNLIGELREAAERLPNDAGDFELTRTQARRIREAWAELGGEGLPEDVLGFLREAGSDGAPIARLSDKVLEWLQLHHLERFFVVTMAESTPNTKNQ